MKKIISMILVLVLCLLSLSACFVSEPTQAVTTAYYYFGNGLLAVSRGEENRLLSLELISNIALGNAHHQFVSAALRIIYSDTGTPVAVALLDRRETFENEKQVSLVPSKEGGVLEGHISLDRWDGHVRLFCAEDGRIARIECDRILDISVDFLADGRVGAVDDMLFTYEENSISFVYSDDVPTRVTYNEKGLPIEATMEWRKETATLHWQYDKKGRCISYESRSEGMLRQSCVYEYDKRGNPKQYNTFVYSLEGIKNAQGEGHYAYDGEGRLTEYRYYLFTEDGKELLEVRELSYVPKTETLVSHTLLEPREERKTVTEYAYDENVERLTASVYDVNGTLTETRVTQNTYDTYGRLTKHTVTLSDPEGNRTSLTEYSYLYCTAQQRLEEKEEWWSYEADGKVGIYTLHQSNYGEDGKRLKKIEARFAADGSGTYGSVYEYAYDELGWKNCVVETAYREDGSVKRKTTTGYNEHGLEISKENIFYPETTE